MQIGSHYLRSLIGVADVRQEPSPNTAWLGGLEPTGSNTQSIDQSRVEMILPHLTAFRGEDGNGASEMAEWGAIFKVDLDVRR